jgi:hypothetical protein
MAGMKMDDLMDICRLYIMRCAGLSFNIIGYNLSLMIYSIGPFSIPPMQNMRYKIERMIMRVTGIWSTKLIKGG